MNEEKLYQAKERARVAEALLNNEVMTETFEYLENTYIQVWKSAKKPEDREAVWYFAQALARVREHLFTVINDGRLADDDIRELMRKQAA